MGDTNPQLAVSNSLQPLPEPSGNKNFTKGTASTAGRTSSTLLADINFERKNKPQPRLPPNRTIQTRPITHPPVASPYAGPEVQKVVYVSKKTPIMAAVKRVRKLLEQSEKRNLQREGVLGNGKRAGNMATAIQTKNWTKHEVVLVKASGRAIEQAAKVGEWFKRHAEDGDGGWVVRVRPTSVKVVDDIVESTSAKVDKVQAGHQQLDASILPDEPPPGDTEGGDVQINERGGTRQLESGDNLMQDEKQISRAGKAAPKQKKLRLKKRKRPMYDEDDIPEARTRFVNAVEIAVSLSR